MFKLS